MVEPIGPCDWCAENAIVKVNDARGCADHIDQAMQAGVAPAKAFIEAITAHEK